MVDIKKGDVILTISTGSQSSRIFVAKEVMEDGNMINHLLPVKILQEYEILLEKESRVEG